MAGTTSGVAFTKNGDRLDMTIFQGKTIDFNFVWGGSTPIDVTGYAARMQLRAKKGDTDPIAEFTVANGRISVGTTDGVISVSMTAADCAALSEGSGSYDMEVIDGSGKVMQAFSGLYTITREVSR